MECRGEGPEGEEEEGCAEAAQRGCKQEHEAGALEVAAAEVESLEDHHLISGFPAVLQRERHCNG